jgi:hypothetical protein
MKNSLLFLSLLFLSLSSFAQKNGASRKFGKVIAEDLKPTAYALDSSANAVILYDFGDSQFIGNTRGWFSLQYTQHRIVHVLKKGGYDMGTVEIPLYVDGSNEEKLVSLKAVTYNLQDGKVVEARMDKASVFTDRKDKNHLSKKFTLPNIKEGSVIEYEYTMTSDFLFNLKPWSFQGTVPRLWSEYKLALPDFLGYIFLSQGYLPFAVNDQKARREQYRISDNTGAGASESGTLVSNVTDFRWAMKDVPELKDEGFTSTLFNHISRIDFQLSEFKQPLTPKQIMRNWPQASKELMESEDFGKHLYTQNGWLSDDVKPLLAGATSNLQKAKTIYAFVRDNFACNDHYAMELSQPLKTVLKNRKGNVSDINLLLTAMLRYAGIDASPVILSTRENGFAYDSYPVMNRFNYVVCQAHIDGKSINLDASHSRLGFGKMPYECYNGMARLIGETPIPVELSSDSLLENKVSSLILIDKDGKWEGSFSQQFGYYESYDLRNNLKDEGEESIFKKMMKVYGDDVKTQWTKIDSLKDYDLPLTVRYKFTLPGHAEDILYLNPLFGEAKRENPFKSAERYYPVEMPYTMDETYVATIFVPAGYTVEELPKQLKVRLNEKNEGMFEYAIAQSGDIISLRSRIKLNRANFMAEEYEMLREFFNLIVKKHSEQIVLKKKK